MAVKLEPLMRWDQSCSVEKLIPFSNYSRWERKPARAGRSLIRGTSWKTLHRKQELPEDPWSVRPEKKSSVPKLPRTVGAANSLPKIKPIHKPQEPPEISILKYEVGTKKESVKANLVYSHNLFARNFSLMEDINKMEEETHSYTNELLDRYEHYKGAMAKLKLKSSESISEAREELENTRASLHKQIEELRAKVSRMDSEIEKCSRELQVLRHYKDNEFPVRVVRIEQMKDRLDEEYISHNEEMDELKQDIEEKKEQFQQKVEANKTQMKAKATKDYLKNTKKSVEAKAVQNNLMRKELLLHEKERTALTRDIAELKSSIAELKSSLGRKILYKKCLPDSEVLLNIPTQELLPF